MRSILGCSSSVLRHVADQDPFILGPEETVFDNLVYGFKQLPEEKSAAMEALKERVYRILDDLHASQEVVDNLFQKDFVGTNGDKLSRYTAVSCSISALRLDVRPVSDCSGR